MKKILIRSLLAVISIGAASYSLAKNKLDWYEIYPGVEAGVDKKQSDKKTGSVYIDVTVTNNTSTAFPPDSQLIITSTKHEIINATGTNDSGLPYFTLVNALEPNTSEIVRLAFPWPPNDVHKFTMGFNYGNVTGELLVSGSKVVGSELSATIDDFNGVTSAEYQWYADGNAISGANAANYIIDADVAGKKLSVTAAYTDAGGYAESLVSDESSRVVTTVVAGKNELAAAVSSANDGDWIGLADGDYTSIPELDIETAITLTLAEDSSAVISGPTCIALTANNSGIIGLTFDAIDYLSGSQCASNGESSIYLDADNITISENAFLGEVATPSNSTYNWISVKDSYSLFERNLFQGKNTNNKGAAISLFNNASIGDQNGHIIQYNLFKDFIGGDESSAYALQIGRSTGSSANGDGAHIVRYNRFENVQTKQRIIKVQSSFTQIYNNTFEDSIGNISLENGESNYVANNIILPTGEDADSNDGGISFTPYGHTITGNYIAGLRTTSSQRGAFTTNSERFGDSGNQLLVPSAVNISNNTVINSRQPFNFSSKSCSPETFIIHFNNNLIANGEDPTPDELNDDGNDYGFEGRLANGTGRDAIIDDCNLSQETTHNNEHYYSRDLSKNGSFVFNNGAGNMGADNTEGLADLAIGNFGLLEGIGIDAGIGATTSELTYLINSDVGPGSSFTADLGQSSYDLPISFDLSTWNITFPDGSSEKDPQWLIDGNTSADEFYYGADGSMVFKTPNIGGTTTNSSYSRTELREMLRGPEQDPKPEDFPDTQGLTKNNWVFSTSYQAIEHSVGGVDGTMSATLRIDNVSTDGDSSQVGRVIVGQIHASDDEPVKIYYRKLPGNELGSVYFNTEIPGLGDITYNLIGTSSSNSPNPIDGIALGEIWSYDIIAKDGLLTVNLHREGRPSIAKTFVIDEAYKNDWMYFKAGVYNQNNTGANSYAQVTFFSLTKSHDAPPSEPGDGSDEDEDLGDTNDGNVVNATSLQSALASAAAGDTIELTDGDYNDMGTIVIGNDDITLTRAVGSSAKITGITCLYVTGKDVRITGLEFENIAQEDGSFCHSNGDAIIAINGDRATFDNNVLNGDALNPVAAGEDTLNWLSLKKSDAIVERNTFQNRQGMTDDGSGLKGGFITVYTTGSGTNNTIQYNLFKDFESYDQSTSYPLQIGRSTGSDSQEDGLNIIQYNRFDNMDAPKRLMRVSGSSNIITHNTIVNSQGMIALEDGQFNEVSNNVILPNSQDSNDGGISFAPFGHIISNNYIAGSRTTSGERGALVLDSNATGSGNSSATPSAVIVIGNTLINNKQPILFSSKGCGSSAFIVDFGNNLIANGVNGVSDDFEGATVTGRPAVRDDCAVDSLSVFNDESYYTTDLSVSGTLTLNGSNNFVGLEDGADLTADTNGLIFGSGIDADKGANTTELIVIEESDVGVGSITVF